MVRGDATTGQHSCARCLFSFVQTASIPPKRHPTTQAQMGHITKPSMLVDYPVDLSLHSVRTVRRQRLRRTRGLRAPPGSPSQVASIGSNRRQLICLCWRSCTAISRAASPFKRSRSRGSPRHGYRCLQRSHLGEQHGFICEQHSTTLRTCRWREPCPPFTVHVSTVCTVYTNRDMYHLAGHYRALGGSARSCEPRSLRHLRGWSGLPSCSHVRPPSAPCATAQHRLLKNLRWADGHC